MQLWVGVRAFIDVLTVSGSVNVDHELQIIFAFEFIDQIRRVFVLLTGKFESLLQLFVWFLTFNFSGARTVLRLYSVCVDFAILFFEMLEDSVFAGQMDF